jgi:hypothetical protein
MLSICVEPEMDKMAEHSITRRVFYLYERAVKKFKADVGLWVEYIKCTMDFKSRALAGRICARYGTSYMKYCD